MAPGAASIPAGSPDGAAAAGDQRQAVVAGRGREQGAGLLFGPVRAIIASGRASSRQESAVRVCGAAWKQVKVLSRSLASLQPPGAPRCSSFPRVWARQARHAGGPGRRRPPVLPGRGLSVCRAPCDRPELCSPLVLLSESAGAAVVPVGCFHDRILYFINRGFTECKLAWFTKQPSCRVYGCSLVPPPCPEDRPDSPDADRCPIRAQQGPRCLHLGRAPGGASSLCPRPFAEGTGNQREPCRSRSRLDYSYWALRGGGGGRTRLFLGPHRHGEGGPAFTTGVCLEQRAPACGEPSETSLWCALTNTQALARRH